MLRSPYCCCSERQREGWFPEIFFEMKEIHLKSVLYRREGCYPVKKLFTRVWEPSAVVAMDTGMTRHLCRRFFWAYVGLDSAPTWFICPVFPGWIMKKEEIKAGLPRTLPGGPDSSRAEARGRERKALVAKLKYAMEKELSRKLSAINARWT